MPDFVTRDEFNGAGKGATLEAGAGLEIVASTGGVATGGVCIADVSYIIVP